MSDPAQKLRLQRALDIYKQAFQVHISAVLHHHLGRDWWNQGIVQAIPQLQQDIDHENDPVTGANRMAEMLEPKHYHWIIKEHRGFFPKLFSNRSQNIVKIGGSPTTLMHEVAD